MSNIGNLRHTSNVNRPGRWAFRVDDGPQDCQYKGDLKNYYSTLTFFIRPVKELTHSLQQLTLSILLLLFRTKQHPSAARRGAVRPVGIYFWIMTSGQYIIPYI